MTESKKLISVRDKLVHRRRAVIDRFQTTIADESDGRNITHIQNAIDAVDRAIADEVLAESKGRV